MLLLIIYDFVPSGALSNTFHLLDIGYYHIFMDIIGEASHISR